MSFLLRIVNLIIAILFFILLLYLFTYTDLYKVSRFYQLVNQHF